MSELIRNPHLSLKQFQIIAGSFSLEMTHCLDIVISLVAKGYTSHEVRYEVLNGFACVDFKLGKKVLLSIAKGFSKDLLMHLLDVKLKRLFIDDKVSPPPPLFFCFPVVLFVFKFCLSRIAAI